MNSKHELAFYIDNLFFLNRTEKKEIEKRLDIIISNSKELLGEIQSTEKKNLKSVTVQSRFKSICFLIFLFWSENKEFQKFSLQHYVSDELKPLVLGRRSASTPWAILSHMKEKAGCISENEQNNFYIYLESRDFLLYTSYKKWCEENNVEEKISIETWISNAKGKGVNVFDIHFLQKWKEDATEKTNFFREVQTAYEKKLKWQKTIFLPPAIQKNTQTNNQNHSFPIDNVLSFSNKKSTSGFFSEKSNIPSPFLASQNLNKPVFKNTFHINNSNNIRLSSFNNQLNNNSYLSSFNYGTQGNLFLHPQNLSQPVFENTFNIDHSSNIMLPSFTNQLSQDNDSTFMKELEKSLPFSPQDSNQTFSQNSAHSNEMLPSVDLNNSNDSIDSENLGIVYVPALDLNETGKSSNNIDSPIIIEDDFILQNLNEPKKKSGIIKNTESIIIDDDAEDSVLKKDQFQYDFSKNGYSSGFYHRGKKNDPKQIEKITGKGPEYVKAYLDAQSLPSDFNSAKLSISSEAHNASASATVSFLKDPEYFITMHGVFDLEELSERSIEYKESFYRQIKKECQQYEEGEAEAKKTIALKIPYEESADVKRNFTGRTRSFRAGYEKTYQNAKIENEQIDSNWFFSEEITNQEYYKSGLLAGGSGEPISNNFYWNPDYRKGYEIGKKNQSAITKAILTGQGKALVLIKEGFTNSQIKNFIPDFIDPKHISLYIGSLNKNYSTLTHSNLSFSSKKITFDSFVSDFWFDKETPSLECFRKFLMGNKNQKLEEIQCLYFIGYLYNLFFKMAQQFRHDPTCSELKNQLKALKILFETNYSEFTYKNLILSWCTAGYLEGTTFHARQNHFARFYTQKPSGDPVWELFKLVKTKINNLLEKETEFFKEIGIFDFLQNMALNEESFQKEEVKKTAIPLSSEAQFIDSSNSVTPEEITMLFQNMQQEKKHAIKNTTQVKGPQFFKPSQEKEENNKIEKRKSEINFDEVPVKKRKIEDKKEKNFTPDMPDPFNNKMF